MFYYGVSSVVKLFRHALVYELLSICLEDYHYVRDPSIGMLACLSVVSAAALVSFLHINEFPDIA